jgi:hypothetical protein
LLAIRLARTPLHIIAAVSLRIDDTRRPRADLPALHHARHARRLDPRRWHLAPRLLVHVSLVCGGPHRVGADRSRAVSTPESKDKPGALLGDLASHSVVCLLGDWNALRRVIATETDEVAKTTLQLMADELRAELARRNNAVLVERAAAEVAAKGSAS